MPSRYAIAKLAHLKILEYKLSAKPSKTQTTRQVFVTIVN